MDRVFSDFHLHQLFLSELLDGIKNKQVKGMTVGCCIGCRVIREYVLACAQDFGMYPIQLEEQQKLR